jgi:hypothetical protein
LGACTEAEIEVPVAQSRPPVVSLVVEPGPHYVGDRIEFDASGTVEPDGQGMTFSWSQLAGPVAEVSFRGARAEVTAPPGPSSVTIEVRVCDESKLCAIAAAPADIDNSPPALSLSFSARALTEFPVSLIAHPSDPDGTPVEVEWRQVSGAAVELAGTRARVASFTPATAGDYEFAARACDEHRACTEANLVVVVADLASNLAPYLTLRGPFSGPEARFEAEAVDPDGDEVVLAWSVDEDCPGALRATGPFAAVKFAGAGECLVGVSACDSYRACSQEQALVERVPARSSCGGCGGAGASKWFAFIYLILVRLFSRRRP